MSAPFIIFSLPRSRSAWLAHWLCGSGRQVGHDLGIECNEPEDLLRSYSLGMAGTVETGGAIEGWRLLRTRIPGLRIVTVRRPLVEVEASLAKFGIEAHEELVLRDAFLDEVEAIGGAESLRFADLDSIFVRKWLWMYCWGADAQFNPQWDAACAITNIQVDMAAHLAQLARRAPAILACQAALRAELKGLAPCPQLN